jgi:antitoxin component of MazEF toxin-antitoxin module
MERKKILKVGDSAAVTLPARFLRETGWKPGQQVIVDSDARTETVVIHAPKAKRRSSIPIEFAAWVEEFIDEHEALLKELAKK